MMKTILAIGMLGILIALTLANQAFAQIVVVGQGGAGGLGMAAGTPGRAGTGGHIGIAIPGHNGSNIPGHNG